MEGFRPKFVHRENHPETGESLVASHSTPISRILDSETFQAHPWWPEMALLVLEQLKSKAAGSAVERD